jgi:Predicted nucleotide-binding protein containing TIR -like domain
MLTRKADSRMCKSKRNMSFLGISLARRSTLDAARRVFVIHGRDLQARDAFTDFLRALDLWPVEWEQLVAEIGSAAPFLGDVVNFAVSRARAVIVLLTPDDVASLHVQLRRNDEPEYETEPTGQPRQNVLIEMGMALMACPHRTIIVEIGRIRSPADIAGRNVVRFDGSGTSLGKIVERLKNAGCAVVDNGGDWRNVERFSNLDAYTRRPV